jgi:hypothetical protein
MIESSQPRRWYEPNIVSNPLTHFGIWTPHGWRVHEKRFLGTAERFSLRLIADGVTTHFRGALRNPRTGRVAWRDDLHVRHDDPFTDAGIYPCDPRIESPAGTPRWAVSHTLMCYPVADHSLYTHEYTWDMTSGDLRMHFRQRVVEQCRTDSIDGMTVRVSHTPISSMIEGNRAEPINNSAVRGVWSNPKQRGDNFYAQRRVCHMQLHNAVYGVPTRTPVLQVHGVYAVTSDDRDVVNAAFDREGICIDEQAVIDRMQIPLDEPKLALIRPRYRKVFSACYQTEVSLPDSTHAEVTAERVRAAKTIEGARFAEGRVGFGADASATGRDAIGYAGYDPAFDFDNDGVVSPADIARLEARIGRRVRHNHYLGAYFGGDWISTGCLLSTEHAPGIEVIADYDHGSGYDAEQGVVRLQRSPGKDVPVWVEYHYDAPAPAGTEIVVHAYREA